MKSIIKIFGVLLATISLASCQKNKGSDAKFGNFDYNGIFLKEYAAKEITNNEAKDLVDVASTSGLVRTRQEVNKPDINNVQAVLTKYGSLTTIVKYYISDKEEQQVRKDLYQGTDFKALLESNHYEPFGQMSVKYIFVDDYLLEDIERLNDEFEQSYSYYVTPFNQPYTYHTTEDNRLILQTHNFAELPASTCGGIGSTFREDCELLFDEEGKITFWQSSLGLYTSTPTGTVREGYIFEVEFEWTAK